ncbi:hypothetical protein [Streptomyces sp. NPDC048002]|uniref:hypothetical protein n=1 Tax=Streptomyces sp. NPDC048002 TaxID=3154344 RepID=UPI0033D9E563
MQRRPILASRSGRLALVCLLVGAALLFWGLYQAFPMLYEFHESGGRELDAGTFLLFLSVALAHKHYWRCERREADDPQDS